MATNQILQRARYGFPVIPQIFHWRNCFAILGSIEHAKPNSFPLSNQHSLFRTFKSAISWNKHSFTESYLTYTCGLSPDSALAASKTILLDSSDKPDLVLELLREQGFSETQISTVIRKRPLLLLAHPQKTLLPKFDFFNSIDVSRDDIIRTITTHPNLLSRSLKNHLIPLYELLMSVVASPDRALTALKHTGRFTEDNLNNMITNLSFLKEIGVAQKCIALLVTNFPLSLGQNSEAFTNVVGNVKEMGFHPEKTTFVLAVRCLSRSHKLQWERCFEGYRRWGWSKDEILAAFKKHPHCMTLSDKKLMGNMDYFVNKMGWPTPLIVQYAMILILSLEKRIIPRCSVIKILLSKGLLKHDYSLSSYLLPTERDFLKKFVTKYEEDVPQLLSVYQGKA